MLAVAWLLQWLAILSCNFITVNTITITNGSSHNFHTFYTAATSPEFATFYDYETSSVGVFCFADSTAVSVFWKFCRALSIFTIILTTLTVTTSVACLLARISIPVEAARLWWGIGLISSIAALLSAPLFWLDPCEVVDATYRDRFDETLATIDSTCTPNTGFIEWILQGALQIMVVIITIITKAPWDVVDPATIEKNDQPAKSLAHSTTSVEAINDETFNDKDERSNSSGEKENNAPLLYHHKLLIKRKRDKKDYEGRSPGGNEYDYIPPPSLFSNE
jgi:hypothetical protein